MQVNLAHIGAWHVASAAAAGKVLHIDDAQRGVLKREFFSAGALPVRQAAGAADRALNFEGFAGCGHGNGLERDAGAAVVKAGLVDLHALVARRVVYFDPRRRLLAGGLVVDDDVAGKKLGHAGRVILDDEFLQLDGKRQLLQQHATGLVQDGRAGLRAL